MIRGKEGEVRLIDVGDDIRLRLIYREGVNPPGQDEEPVPGKWVVDISSIREPWTISEAIARYRSFLSVMRDLKEAGVDFSEVGDPEDVFPEDWSMWLEEKLESVAGAKVVDAIFGEVRRRYEEKKIDLGEYGIKLSIYKLRDEFNLGEVSNGE